MPTSEGEAAALAELWWGILVSTDTSGAWHTMKAYLDSSFHLTKVTCYVYLSSTGGATYVGEYSSTPNPGTSSAAALPLQVGLVLTLRTGSAGRSFRGRMYLPINNLSLDAGHEAPVAALADLCTSWATAFSDWNTGGTGTEVCVISTQRGVATPVTSVTMDSRMDVQRRRANRQAITATTANAVTPMA